MGFYNVVTYYVITIDYCEMWKTGKLMICRCMSSVQKYLFNDFLLFIFNCGTAMLIYNWLGSAGVTLWPHIKPSLGTEGANQVTRLLF